MTTDLEASILEFLREKVPKKHYVSAREILFCLDGKYPTSHRVGKVEEILLGLWSKYIVEEKRSRPTYKSYRLKR